MTNRKKSIVISILQLASSLIMGCSDTSAPPASPQVQLQQAREPGATPSMTPPASELTMFVQISKVVGAEKTTESMQRFTNPDAALIEEQIRAIDWHNAERPPTVSLGRVVSGGIRRLSIEGALGAPNSAAALRAQWLGVEDGKVLLRQSPPLESLDAAIQIVLAFHNDDPKLRTLVEWEVKESE